MQNSPRAAVVVFNPAKIDEERLRTVVERHAPSDCRIEWVATTPDDSGEAETAALRGTDVDLVLVAGGDGTVREVGTALANSEVAMGIVPTLSLIHI